MSASDVITSPVEDVIPDKRDKVSFADYLGPVVVFLVFIVSIWDIQRLALFSCLPSVAAVSGH
jgi:hypothetical protein